MSDGLDEAKPVPRTHIVRVRVHTTTEGVHTYDDQLTWYVEDDNPRGTAAATSQSYIDFLRHGSPVGAPAAVEDEVRAFLLQYLPDVPREPPPQPAPRPRPRPSPPPPGTFYEPCNTIVRTGPVRFTTGVGDAPFPERGPSCRTCGSDDTTVIHHSDSSGTAWTIRCTEVVCKDCGTYTVRDIDD